MKSRILAVTGTAVIFALVLLGAAPLAHAGQCSQANASGKYGFTLSGLLILPSGPVPIAGVGRANVDARGNVTGTETRSVGGGVADETLSGTLTLNSDCTGTFTVEFFEAGQLVRTSVLAVVLDDNNNEFRMVQTSLTLPNGATVPVVVTVEAKKIFHTEED